ncbi:MAG: arsenate reductase [Gemmatimonadaceae bacterium]|nr:arsenate reductase [Gemmatimonadaceae bacterium]
MFGVKKSADTRKALRFFAERRVRTHFVDFDERAPALGELRRFVQKYGIEALIDREGNAFTEMGLRYATYSEQRMLEKIMEEPRLLRLPLARQIGGGGLTVGLAESEWKGWVGK